MNESETTQVITEGRKLWRLLGRTYDALLDASKLELEPFGIQYVRAWTLWGLKAMDRPVTITEMSQILERDRHATDQLLKRMEGDGLVKRSEGQNKGKRVTVSLSENGEALICRILDDSRAIDEITSCLTSEEKGLLTQLLNKLRKEALTRNAKYSRRLPEPYASKVLP